MSKQYDNELRGSLFKNDRKTEDKHPEYKGQAQINGLEYWVSAWVKTSKEGVKYMSLSYQLKEGQNSPKSAPIADNKPLRDTKPAPTIMDDMDDDLPF
jgi:hypothetical protein